MKPANTITIEELERDVHDVLERVTRGGETLAVTRGDRAVLRIEPVGNGAAGDFEAEQPAGDANPAEPKGWGCMRGTFKITGDIVSPVFDDYDVMEDAGDGIWPWDQADDSDDSA